MISKRVICLMCGLIFAGAVGAQNAPTPGERAQEAVDTRKAVFKLLKFNLVPLIGMARGQVEVDTAKVEKSAVNISQLGAMITATFQADTREFDLETEALDVIWEDMDGFEEKAADLVKRADELAKIAASGDKDATRKAIGATGQGCGGCHDNFREE